MSSKLKFVFISLVYFISTFSNCYSANITPDDRTIDDRYDKLIACLVKSGISDGKIFPRNDGPEYAELNYQWNTLWGTSAPLVYLKATTVSDIRNAVVCSTQTKIRIVAKSGGHSYVKNGFGDTNSLVVDLSSINHIDIDKNTMTAEVGPGARNGQIMYGAWKEGCLVSQGICPSVGIGGLALGGGYGHFSRFLGLAADSVIEMKMVDAKGRDLIINNSTNTDLFWALRGGGGGNFGIVYNFKLKIYDSPTSIIAGNYEYSFKNEFTQVFNAWQKIITIGLSNYVFCVIEFEQDRISMKLYAINTPKTPIVTVEDIERLRAHVGFPEPGSDSSIKSMTHREFLLSEGQLYSALPLTDPSELALMIKHNKVYNKKVKSYFVKTILNQAGVAKLQKLMADYLPYAGVYWEYNGGAINNNPGTCFIHRGDVLYSAQLKPLNSQGILKNLDSDAAKSRYFAATKELFNHNESYQNYLDRDPDMSDFLQRFYGKNLRKLIQIKRKYDYHNIFYSCESIPTRLGAERICNY